MTKNFVLEITFDDETEEETVENFVDLMTTLFVLTNIIASIEKREEECDAKSHVEADGRAIFN